MKPPSRKAVALSAVFLSQLSISLRAAAEEDPFAANVRPTPHLSPEEERVLQTLLSDLRLRFVARSGEVAAGKPEA